jgi:predicted phosphodiesterase
MKWTDKRLERAKSILENHSDYEKAVRQIGESKGALYKAFKRNGMKAPTEYLGENVPNMSKASTPDSGLYKIVIANDFHIPFHNPQAVDNWLEFCEDLQPEYIVINGDFLDCFSISSFPKLPGKPLLQDELDMGIEILDELRGKCPDAEIWYLQGNHEERLARLVKDNDGLFRLRAMQLENLLELDRNDIHYREYMNALEIGDLSVVHGNIARKHSAYSAKGTVQDFGYNNVVVGHTHRMGWYMHDGANGRRRGLENGGLFSKEQADYMDGPANWQNGFCTVYQDEEKDFLQIHPVEMDEDGSFVWSDKMYGKEN